jgi:hypothetical protein
VLTKRHGFQTGRKAVESSNLSKRCRPARPRVALIDLAALWIARSLTLRDLTSDHCLNMNQVELDVRDAGNETVEAFVRVRRQRPHA